MREEALGVLGVLGKPAGGRPQVGFQHRPPAGQAPEMGRGGAKVDPLADRVEGVFVADTVDHRAVQVVAGVGGLLAAQYGLGQVDGDEVGQARDGHLGEFLGGTGHVQGGADAGAGLGQQVQTAACRDGVLPHSRFAHEQEPGGHAARGVTGGAGCAGRAGRRGEWTGNGARKVPGRRAGGGGRMHREPERRADVSGGGELLRRVAVEDRLDGDAFDPGRTRHRTAQEGDPSAAGQGHLDGGPLSRGDQLDGLLREDHLITPVQVALGHLAHRDQPPVPGRVPGPHVVSGIEIGVQQGALARRALLQQPAFDGSGRPAYHGVQRRVRVGARKAEAEDALDAPAERVANGNRRAGARLGALGEVFGSVDVTELPVRKCETDTVRPTELLGEHEARDALDRGESLHHGHLAETTLKNCPAPVGEGHVHPTAREPGFQPVQHGSGSPDETAVQIQIVPIREVGLVR